MLIVPKLREGMIPVKWKDDSWFVTDSSDDNWYNYGSKTMGKYYANRWNDSRRNYKCRNSNFTRNEKGKKVTSVGSMFVWIPRYAYRITENYHKGGDSITGKVDICFLKKQQIIQLKKERRL